MPSILVKKLGCSLRESRLPQCSAIPSLLTFILFYFLSIFLLFKFIDLRSFLILARSSTVAINPHLGSQKNAIKKPSNKFSKADSSRNSSFWQKMSFMHTHEIGRKRKKEEKKHAGILESFAQTVFCQLSAESSNMGKIPRERDGRRRRRRGKNTPQKAHTQKSASIKTPRQMVYTLNCWVI